MRRRLAPLILLGALIAAPAACAAPCWYENGALVVSGTFGDITGDFVVDTSSPVSRLHNTIAEAAGFEATALTDDLRFAGVRVPEAALAVEDLDARSVGFPTTIVGVIGADVLSRFVIDIDFAPCRISLSDRAGPRRPGAVRLGVTGVAGVPAIEATAFDGAGARAGRFAVDTASAGLRFDPEETSFSRPLAPGVDPTLRFRPPARLRGLSLGGEAYSNTPAGLMETATPGLAGAIGDAVWSRHHVRLDLRGGWIELSPPAAAPPQSSTSSR